MSLSRPLEIERVFHVPGEMLGSHDLGAQVHANAELMWWHQRALHDAPGIVAGLTATVQADGTVVVAPGLGFDARGREVLLRADATIPLPEDVSHTFALVLRRCGEGRAPQLAWIRIDRMERCDGVPLARVIPDGGLEPWPGRARPIARPRAAFGSTLPGSTAWLPWLALERIGAGFGLETRVDTRAAGFSGRPCYFAWLLWPEIGESDPRIASWSLGLQHLADETTEGFTFRVVVLTGQVARERARRGRLAVEAALLTLARTTQLGVAWIGVDDDGDGGSGP
jgi:hypothetical protein